jgi:putative aminopeptidase FrvX
VAGACDTPTALVKSEATTPERRHISNHLSLITSHLSPITFHLSPVTNHLSPFTVAIMNSEALQFLFHLLNTPSPTGFEAEGQKVWLNYLSRFSDTVANDAYGNAWATLNGEDGSLTVMLEAHADEIGFMIQNITDEGFIYLNRIGGSDRAIARSKRIKILGDNGPVLGIIGNTAIHLREKDDDKIPEVHQLFVDIGARSRKEVEERGIRIGHPAVYTESAEELVPGKIVGRAIDNRIGGFIISQVFAGLSTRSTRCRATLYGLNAVQEEIGGYGARMAAFRLEPGAAVILDVTHATDSPGIDRNKHGSIKLGAGPSITHGSSNHPLVVERLSTIATELNIPIQHEASSRTTGTDTDLIFQSKRGIPSGLVSIPMRYMHSTVETIDLQDVERCIQLLTEFIVRFTEASAFHPKLA